MQYWLVKSEPFKWSWDQHVKKGVQGWDGVRNYQASNNMKAMQIGDQAFFYHSNIGKEIVGVVEISVAGIPDPTDPEGKWAAVKVRPLRKLPNTVTLAQIKADERLADIELVRQSRLSVAEIRPSEWEMLLEMAGE